jgi:arsenate reductase
MSPIGRASEGQHRPVVLFVRFHNAGRSHIAAALVRELNGGAVDVRSGSFVPAGEIHPGWFER